MLIALAGVSLGIVAGVLMRLPIFPYVLPDEVANAISAGAGAALAVIGAAWVAERKERRQLRDLQLVLRGIGRPLEDALAEVIKMCDSKESQKQKLDLLRRKLRKIKIEHDAYGPRLDELRPMFLLVGPRAMFAFLRLNQVRTRVAKLIEAMESAEKNPNNIEASFLSVGEIALRARKRLVTIKDKFGTDLGTDEVA